MIEAEWQVGTDPRAMLAALGSRASARKLRLYGCACCRLVWHLLIDDRSRSAVEVAERLADGLATEEEVMAASHAAAVAALGLQRGPRPSSLTTLWLRRRHGPRELFRAAAMALAAVNNAGELGAHIRGEEPQLVEALTRARLLRCVFSNPFRAAALDAAGRSPLARVMAQTIYDERHFDELPVLADALEEAGCRSPDLLAHLRAPGPHVRGCWPLDLILGRE